MPEPESLSALPAENQIPKNVSQDQCLQTSQSTWRISEKFVETFEQN